MTVSDSATCRLLADGAEVLARTASGEPIVTRFASGKGTVFVCNAPIDRATVARTDVLTGENIQPYYLVLRMAANAARISRVVEKGDCPWVAFTEHPASDGSTIVMAVNYEPRALVCPVKINGRLGRVWRGGVAKDAVTLEPNEAALFEVVR